MGLDVFRDVPSQNGDGSKMRCQEEGKIWKIFLVVQMKEKRSE